MITTQHITSLMNGFDTDTDLESLRPGVSLEEQGVDSMDMTTLIARVEQTYDIKIPTAAADELHTLDQFVDYLNNNTP